MKTCGNCKWYRPHVNPSGRVAPTKLGSCGFEVILPLACELVQRVAFRANMWKETAANECKCWSGKVEKPKAIKQLKQGEMI